MAKSLPGGVYIPMPTFFLDEPADEQPVDVDSVARHVKYLCSAGVQGVICMGSTGEAVHLDEEERKLVIRTSRQAMNEISSNAKLIAGCSQESVRGTLRLIEQAAKEGADYAMVLPPSYFLAWTNRSDVLYSFYTKVADKAPIPIIIYNFPAVTQNMDTPQETLVKLATHPNIVGMKCTDGNVGKAGYVCQNTNRKEFTLMSGSGENFIPFLTVGAQGCVPGFGNIAPRILCRLYDWYENHAAEEWEEIKRLQGIVVGADQAFFRTNGISGVKAAMQHELGYGGLPRAPLLPTTAEQLQDIIKGIEPALEIERQLASKSSNK